MNQKNEVLFTTVQSQNGNFQVKIGKPVNTMVNLFFNFNVFAYREFGAILEQLPYLNVTSKQNYDDGNSGMGIELFEDNCLSKFIEDLPDLVYLYVENVEPMPTVHLGTKSNKL